VQTQFSCKRTFVQLQKIFFAFTDHCQAAHANLEENGLMQMRNGYEKAEPTRADIDELQGATVIEFGTPWCGYCVAAQPLLAAALRSFPSVRHIKIQDGRRLPLGRSFRVKLWPTFIFLNDGKEVARLVRPASSDQITAALAGAE
jgi:thioredoxin 1